MKGTIRCILGLIVVMGAAGGLDTATDAQLLSCVGIAVAGLALMYSGVSAMNRKEYLYY